MWSVTQVRGHIARSKATKGEAVTERKVHGKKAGVRAFLRAVTGKGSVEPRQPTPIDVESTMSCTASATTRSSKGNSTATAFTAAVIHAKVRRGHDQGGGASPRKPASSTLGEEGPPAAASTSTMAAAGVASSAHRVTRDTHIRYILAQAIEMAKSNGLVALGAGRLHHASEALCSENRIKHQTNPSPNPNKS